VSHAACALRREGPVAFYSGQPLSAFVKRRLCYGFTQEQLAGTANKMQEFCVIAAVSFHGMVAGLGLMARLTAVMTLAAGFLTHGYQLWLLPASVLIATVALAGEPVLARHIAQIDWTFETDRIMSRKHRPTSQRHRNSFHPFRNVSMRLDHLVS
jgi:hypothetical protein